MSSTNEPPAIATDAPPTDASETPPNGDASTPTESEAEALTETPSQRSKKALYYALEGSFKRYGIQRWGRDFLAAHPELLDD